jgi:Auxin binding protein
MRNVYILMILVCAILAGSSSWMVGEPEGQLPITFDKMLRIKGPPGEVLYVVEGKDHGLESLSTVITVTQPGSGAPPHKHKCEEVHILTKGKVQYTVGGIIYCRRPLRVENTSRHHSFGYQHR